MQVKKGSASWSHNCHGKAADAENKFPADPAAVALQLTKFSACVCVIKSRAIPKGPILPIKSRLSDIVSRNSAQYIGCNEVRMML